MWPLSLAKLPYDSKNLDCILFIVNGNRVILLKKTYKLLHGYYDIDWSRYFMLSSVYHTREHHMKPFKTHHVLF